MAKTGRKLGKMGLAMLDFFIEIRLGDKYNKKPSAQMEEQIAIKKAMQNTASRLWKDWADKRPWNALFIDLPKDKGLLIDLKQAARKFYQHPTDMDFSGVLVTILSEHNELSPEAVQAAVGEYTTTLAEELLLVDKSFHDNMKEQPGQLNKEHVPEKKEQEERVFQDARIKQKKRPVKNISKPSLETDTGSILKSVEEEILLTAQVKLKEQPFKDLPEPTLKTGDGIIITEVEEVTLKAARASLRNFPAKRVLKPSKLPKCSHFPELPPDPLFVGREDFLLQLAGWIKGTSTEHIIPVAILTGMEGIGKTCLAREFAYRYGRYFPGGVFWSSFAQPDMIPYEVAECSGLSYHTPLGIRVRQVQSDWKSDIPRLLIFDSCEDPLILEKWLPNAGGSRVLVTSRQDHWELERKIQLFPLTPLARKASLTLLRGYPEYSDTDDPTLDAISNDLEDVPLANHLAGGTLRMLRQVMSPEAYLNAIRQPGRLRVHSTRNGEFSPVENDLKVERIVAIGIERLSEGGDANRQSLDLLRQIACCVPGEFVPRELFTANIASGLTGELALEKGLNKLLGMGLVEQNKVGELRMHRLVAWLVREILPDGGAQSRVEKAILSVAVAANQNGNLERIWPLLVHIKHFTDQMLKKKNRQAARLATELGIYLVSIGDYAGARLYFTQAVEINRKILGEEHPDTTVSHNNLGRLLVRMGDYVGARPYFRHSLEIHRKVLGEEHPDTASSLNDLGEVAANLGDFAGAWRYYDQALAIRRRILGENHPDTASSLNALGGIMARLGDYPAARQYCEQALAIRRQVLGEEHPDSAASLNNLGEVLQAMGDQEEARSCYGQALAIRRKVLGDEHPESAASFTNIGGLLQAMGDYSGARNTYEQALAIRKSVLGEAHPATLASLNNLGNLLLAMGDQTGANTYFEQALAINQKIQDENRPTTPSRTGLLALPWRARIALVALLVLAVTVIGWQVFSQRNVSSTSINWFIATPSEVGAAPNAWLFPQLGPRPTRTASRTPTATRTRTPSPTPTKYLSPTPTDTPLNIIVPTKTRTRTPTRFIPLPTTPVPTNTHTGPTDTPSAVPTTAAPPTAAPTDTLPVTPATPVFPTDTPIPTDTPAPFPPDTPVPATAAATPIAVKEVSVRR